MSTSRRSGIGGRFIGWGLACALLAAGAALADTADLDADVMRAIEDANKSLASNIALGNAASSTSDAAELETMFAQVEAHFAARGNAQKATELARASRELSQQVIKSVAAQDFGAATEAATTLSRTCRTCHTFYKKS